MMSKGILIAVIIVLIIIATLVLWWIYTKSPVSQNSTTQTSGNTSQEPTHFAVQGVTVDIEKQGTGPGAVSGNTVVVNYVGTLENGTKFDSSYDRKQAFSFILGKGQVIKGWDVGVVGMKMGEKRKLTIPAAMAYGASGIPAAGIPANATLIFEVELLKISN